MTANDVPTRPVNTTPQFSVLIPTYGRAEFLARALESVVAQTVDDWECIVAVDGGDAPVVLPDRRIRVVQRAQNGGPAAARNTALASARGAHIGFLDDDDTWLPERLEMTVAALRRAPVVVCFGLSNDRVAWQGSWEGDVSQTLLDEKVPSLNGVVVRADAAVRFDERLRGAEDVDWLLRVAQHAPFTTVPRAGFARHNAGTHRPDADRRLASQRLFMEIHAEYLSRHPRAAARRWRLLGDLAARAGRASEHRQAYYRALRAEPNWWNVRAFLRAALTR